MPYRNEVNERMIGSDSLHYFIIFRGQMYKKRLKTNLIKKLSYYDIFNMNRKSMSCKGILKMDERIAKR